MLKEKVQEILTKKLEKKEKDKITESSSRDKKEISEPDPSNSSPSTEAVKEVVENIKSEESKSVEKYSSTFESDDDNGTDTKSVKSAKSDSEDEEKSLTVPSEKSNDSSESPENGEEPVNVRETPPPAETDYQQKMLSTIEEVTTVADTEDNDEDYSDNFVTSNISSNPEVQYSSPASESVAASNDVTELEDSQERDRESGEHESTDGEKINQEPSMEIGQDPPSREEEERDCDQQREEDQGEDQPDREDVVDDIEAPADNSPSKEAVFVSLPLELSNDESLPACIEEDHRDHAEITEEDLDSLQDQHEDHIEELAADDSTNQVPLSGNDHEVKLDDTLPAPDEDTADNIETGMLSSDDTETDGGAAVPEDPQQVDILKLDIETGLLTPEKPESEEDDPVLR